MTDRLNFDPRNILTPDFASNTYATIRRALIADADSPGIVSEAEAQQHLRDQWEEENRVLRARYEAQLEEDQAIAEARIEEAAEEQRVKDAERKAKEDELAKKAEEKRTPLYSFKQGVGVGCIRQQIHPYAKKLMAARKYVPLWYFLPEATAEAKEHNREAVDNNHFQIAMDETNSSNSSLTLVGSHTVRASPNAVPDSRLSWDQVMRAKSSFLNALTYGEFTNDFIKMFAGFYTGMDMHPELREEHGDRVLALYHAEMRRAWYEGFERREPFDLAVLSEDTLEKCRIEIRRQNSERMIKEMQAVAVQYKREIQGFSQTSYPAGASQHIPNKPRNTPYPSTSPRKASNFKEENDLQKSFREATQRQLSQCHRCLGRDKHNIRRCSRTSLWNGKKNALCGWNAKGYLEIATGQFAGLELCAEWQQPNGCINRKHMEKHQCSGCASTHHGADGCPEGQ